MDQVEPMDIDSVGTDFDDKENSLLHSNVLPRTPCTEKGYEELDVSELNMKLRYSITPASSPMSKSFTANCKDNKTYSINEDSLNSTIVNNSTTLTRSLNSTITKSDVSKSPKLPLQALQTDQYLDMNSTVRRSLDNDPNNITISINGNDIDENISLPSTSSSAVETPGATTPTKEIPKDGGSPIMRGLKSVFNMFRTSQSPIPPDENLDNKEVSGFHLKEGENKPDIVLVSTPKASDKNKENLSKRNSPLRDSMSFKDDLERELQWKDDSTIIFKHEKIPIHKLFLQQSISAAIEKLPTNTNESEKFNSSVEYMDISYNDSVVVNKTMTDIDGKIISSNVEGSGVESDGEFLDCETTYTKIDDICSEQINTTIPLGTENKELLQEVCTDKNISLDESQGKFKNIANNTEVICKDLSSHGGNIQYEEQKSLSSTLDNDNLENVINELQELIEEENEENNGQLNSSPDLSTIDGNVQFDEQKPLSNTLDNVKPKSIVNEIHGIIPDEKDKDNIDELISSKDLSTIDGTIQIDKQKPLSNTLDNVKPENVVNDVRKVVPDRKDENNVQLISSKDLSTIDGSVQFDEQKPLSSTLDDVKSENVVNNVYKVIPVEREEENNCQLVSSKDLSTIDANVQFDEQKLFIPLDTIKPDNAIKNIHELKQDVKEEQNKIQFEDLKILSTTFNDVELESEINKTYNQIPDVAIEECKIESNLVDEIKVHKNVTTVLEVSADKTESNNQEDQSNISVPRKSENYGFPLDDIAQDSIELTFDITKPLNIVTDDDNTLAKVHDKSNNFEIIEQERLKVIELDSHPLNSGILQICESKNSVTVYDHTNTTLGNQDLKLECVELKDNKIDNQVVGEKSEVNKNSSFVSKNEVLNEMIRDHCEELQNMADRVELTSLNHTIDSLDLNKEQDLENQISCLNYVENEVQSSSNEIIEKPINVNDLGFNKFLRSDNTPNFSDDTLQLSEPQVTELINNLPSDIPLPSDDDIEKDSLMDNFEIQNKNVVETLSNVYRGSFSIKDQIMDSLEPMEVDIQDVITINSENSNGIMEMLPAANLEKIQKNIDTLSNLPTSTDITSNETVVLNESATVVTENNPTFLDTSSELNKLSTKRLSLDKTAPIKPNEDHKRIDCEQIVEEIILTESVKIINEELRNHIMSDEGLNNNKLVEEEIVTSANSSPFVSIENLHLGEPKNDINLDEIESPFETTTKVALSPPISPKLIRKGYNINFDEIDDPFATKTNIRMSPPPESSPRTSSATINITQKKPDIQKRVQQQNRRQSQPERQKRDVTKKRFNSSYSFDTRGKNYKEQMNTTKPENDNKNLILENYKSDVNSTSTTLVGADQLVAENIDPIDNKCEVDNVSTSANNLFYPNETIIIQDESKPHDTDLIQDNYTEQKSISDNISAARFPSKNVFNLPEIDDMNFNPFASKSKIRNTPSPSFEKETEVLEENNSSSDQINEITQKSAANAKINIESQYDNIKSTDVINETFSLKNIHNDDTLKEIATEDEDTVEGPFLEAEEFADIVKVSDFTSEKDMMQFEDFHTATNPEVKDEEGELFIDAEAFEFLLNQNKSNVVADSGKESLFLKFDPLFAKRISTDGVLAALNSIQKRQSTPKKPCSTSKQNVVVTEERPSVSATNCNTLLEESNDENNITITKPMMVVNPAVNSLVSPRKSTTSPRINRRSLTFTSPAMAVIDRLLSLSGNSTTLDHNASPTRINREYNDTDIALTQLRELLAEKEIHVHNLRSESKELKERLTIMESQVKTLEKESEERLKKVNDLNERLAKKTKINENMAVVVEEYERTIASLISEIDQEKRRNAEERARIISERDEQTAHLSSMEVTFSDLHSKYEKSKQIILSMKTNEDTYKKSLKDFEENLLKMQNNYELLKQHATDKLNHANQELEKFNKAHESEVLKLNAMIKRKELHIKSLEESLAQKTKANEELTAICDELINKVG